jgi:hypothetical protein
MALNNETQLASIRARLKELDAERDALRVCLERLASEPSSGANCKSAGASVHSASTEWVRGVCGKPQVKCGECPNQAFIALSDNVIASHLRWADPSRSSSTGFVAGVYPVRVDETCWFLAVDFDGDDWSIDALAYIDTCRLSSVPAALERSRSGKGGHVWIFFSQPIPARDARQLGATLLTETLQRRPEVGFSSYDRMFPSQDTLPKGGFGNLIALPLQRRAVNTRWPPRMTREVS